VSQAAGRIDATPEDRIAWLDVARGIGIVLVVFGHVMRSLIASGVAAPDPAHQLQDELIYAFHMPLFFLLSGLFARWPQAGRRGAFVLSRLQAIAWPYLLWSLIQGILTIYGSRFANHPISWDSLVRILWDPIAHYWFLYVLLLCQALLLAGRRGLLLLVPAGMVAVMLMGGQDMVLRAFYSLPFFAAGVYLTAPRITAWLSERKRVIAMAVLAWLVFLALFLLAMLGHDDLLDFIPVRWCLGFAGAFGVLAVARLIAPYAGLLRALGQASMPIYLIHVIASAVARVMLLRLWPAGGETVYAVLLTLIGLAVPFAIFRLAERFGLGALLGFGQRRPRLGAVDEANRAS
jgi:fucose 4-O-acetylase-like acetyltransferase